MREVPQLQRRPLLGELVSYEIRLGTNPLVGVTEILEGWRQMTRSPQRRHPLRPKLVSDSRD